MSLLKVFRYNTKSVALELSCSSFRNESGLTILQNYKSLKPLSIKHCFLKNNHFASSLFSSRDILNQKRYFNSSTFLNSYQPPGTEGWSNQKRFRYEYLLAASGLIAFLYSSWVFFSSDVEKADKRLTFKYWALKFLPPRLNADTFSRFQLIRKEQLTSDTFLYRFQYPSESQRWLSKLLSRLISFEDHEFSEDFIFPTISHIHVKDDTMQILRPYTLIPSSDCPIEKISSQEFGEETVSFSKDTSVLCFRSPTINLAVKTYPKGPLSQFLSRVPEGGFVEMRGPYLTWRYVPDQYRLISLIAAGTGVAPFYQLLNSALQEKNETVGSELKSKDNYAKDKTRFSLVYYSSSSDSIILKEELDKLQKLHPDRLSVQYFVSKNIEAESKEADLNSKLSNVFSGRLDFSHLANHLRENQFDPSDSQILVCGPDGFLAQVCGPKNHDGSDGPVRAILGHMGLDSSSVTKF